jgi:fatty acid desaturase
VRRTGVDAVALVFGFLFCGGAVVAGLVQTDYVGVEQLTWLIPVVLVCAGALGLAVGPRPR